MRLTSWLVTIAVWCSVGPAAAQESSAKSDVALAQAAIASAMTAAKNGDFLTATATLRTARRSAGSADARATLDFGLGWVLTQEAASVPDDDAAGRKDLLGQATAAYRAVLAVVPHQSQTVVNLALVLQSAIDLDGAEQLLQTEAGRDQPAWRVLCALGDLQRARGKTDAAWSAWRRIIDRDWTQRAAHERIVASARQLGSEHAEEMLAYAKKLSATGMSDLGVQAAAELVHGSRGRRDDIAEAALAEWASQRVDQDRLDVAALAELPSPTVWDNRILRGLWGLATGKGEAALHLADFGDDPAHRHVAAGVLRLRAERAIAANDSASALQLAQASQSIAPPLEVYRNGDLAGRAPALMAATSVMARAILRTQEDVAPETIAALTKALPRKALVDWSEIDAKRAQASMQTIGIALTNRGGDPVTARTYLEDALMVEQAVAAKTQTTPRELPHLHASIAETFARQGLDREAAKAHTEAARRFLRDGDADGAVRQLQRIDPRLRNDAQIESDRKQVEQFVELERELESQSPDAALPRLQALIQARLQARAAVPPGPRGAVDHKLVDWADDVLGRNAAKLELHAHAAGDAATARSLRELEQKLAPMLDPGLRKRLSAERLRHPDR